MTSIQSDRSLRLVGIWLFAGALLIASMVTVGGITRLTGSGLSITEWNVLMGALPPLSQADWVQLFEKYQATPQFQQVNAHFTLEQFKGIFWWEYLHRLLGRTLGLVFLIPFIWFLARGVLERGLRNRVLLIFLLGAFQGALGWFMVASGLSERPAVSQYRLAAHLLTALLTFSLTLWTALEVRRRHLPAVPVPIAIHRQAWGFAVLLALQVTYGALVAGLKAGFAFNTFPLMGGRLVPDGLSLLRPLLANLGDNPVTVQFIHRTLAWLLAGFGLWLWYTLRVHGIRGAANLLAGTIVVQFSLGILTILHLPANPVLWGSLHQAGAVLLLAATVNLLFEVRGEPGAPTGAQEA